jgi:threonine dehydratase
VTSLLTLDDVLAARARIAGAVVRAPLVEVVGTGLTVKAESLQPTGAFKLRGATNAVEALSPGERARGVVTDSSGNHAQAVACAARRAGVAATIVMPAFAPRVKIDATRAHGAEVVLVDAPRAEQTRLAEELAAERGLVRIPPFDHPHVIAGQGTCGLEIAEDMPDVDLVLVPISGGGLISGIAVAVKALAPRTRVVGVEPEAVDDAQRSFRAGEILSNPPDAAQKTLADGLRVDRLGDITWPHVRELVDDVVTVSEDEILDAMRVIARSARLVAEPSGAVAAAAWLHRRQELGTAAHPVAILSGGNVDPAVLARALTG